MVDRDVKVELYLRHMQDLEERWRQLQEMVNPTARLVEELERTSALVRADQLFAGIDASKMQSVARFLEQQTREREQLAQMIGHHTAALGFSAASLAHDLAQQVDSWRQLVSPPQNLAAAVAQNMAGLDSAFTAWNLSAKNLIPRLDELGLLDTHAAFARRIAQPLQVFTDFATDTRRLIEAASSPAIENALRVSLSFADEQCISTTDALAAVVAAPVDTLRLTRMRLPRSSYVQREELLAVAERVDPGDVDGCEQLAPARTAAKLAIGIVRKLARCNTLHLQRDGKELFRPTTRMLLATSSITVSCPEDLRSFAEFVDDLYFIVWEGAGRKRLVKSDGGILEDAESAPATHISLLRNWYRHDPDRGDPAEVRRKRRRLGEVIQSLGLSTIPASTPAFRTAHLRLLEEVDRMLDAILNRLT